ncbi:MAG TPA: phosphoribosylformylglycinamidine synthase [Candidatus Merdenecus merdavium]|nr:phosphoribosylformylglycinamidine synthase [Candidatus Merdenecus merdavium]
MNQVRRVFVEKKPEFSVKAGSLKKELINYLGVKGIEDIRVLIRYDIENISDDIYKTACNTVFSEPPVDLLHEEVLELKENEQAFAIEYLPGQFDQRADSAVQCIQFLKEDEEPMIKTATVYVVSGEVSQEEMETIKAHCMNPVDSREALQAKPETLVTHFDEPQDVVIFDGFRHMNHEQLKVLYDSLNLAMTFQDFLHIYTYYKKEELRDPSMTEIRVLDTYWSDHCRHTTFLTELTKVDFEDGFYRESMEDTYQSYLSARADVYKGRDDKFICLMDLALIAMKKLKQEGKLTDQEETDEINACSIIVPVDVNGKEEEWLINFKNETHNHPTEIEPFGGAATCLGGAIRDPLSGRTYVYQAMRVTGAADPTKAISETMKGKLPQKKIVREAAHGYSSYGNQIGLATGLVREIYHPGYVAKRMEIGAVLGAAPRKNVIRETSDPGDIIILLGGRTGRDGLGGATGSSKVHTEESIETAGAEVQKGNAPTERKIQRLFRREEVSRLIKKCNDFGAGGVSVAIGELADGLMIDLDKVPKKYEGLDGTEIAISESQERMAVVVDPQNVQQFLDYAAQENLEAVKVAVVTKEKRLIMNWRGKTIVNISRAFLDTNGAHQEAQVLVEIPKQEDNYFKESHWDKGDKDLKDKWLHVLEDLNGCSQKGLVEMFDSSIGAGTVVMPYGGKYQMTANQTMVAKVPVLEGETNTVTMMSYGFDPYLSSWSPYHGAMYAVVESVSKIVAAGGDYKKIRFTFQEYFRRMSEDPLRWSQPFSALLGAYHGQMGFGLPSIGGKDSMSGTFQDIDVPPTLVSFAVDTGKINEVITPELKEIGSAIISIEIEKDEFDTPIYEQVKKQYGDFYEEVRSGHILSAYAVQGNGVASALSNMAFGNLIGVKIEDHVTEREVFGPGFGNIIAEVSQEVLPKLTVDYKVIGQTIKDETILYKEMKLSLEVAVNAYTKTLEDVFPTGSSQWKGKPLSKEYKVDSLYVCKHKVAKPKVFIPVFPGTNCEYDSAKAFERAGADVEIKIFKNLSPEDIKDSVSVFEKTIKESQIIMFPGGFSAGDEPDGSAKFFATAFRNQKISEAVMNLVDQRDGLVLGICNGFQALIKLGLVPYGKIQGQTEDSPTLTYNTVGRHISKMVYTKVVSNQSPWLNLATLGQTYVNPASHGEGRFVANKEWIQKLFERGQVATQYVNPDGELLMDEEWNVNGSYGSIEGITSPDGRILGKMAHSERRADGVALNIYGEQDIKIFESGVMYFK